jgi:hypothetical protein
MDQLDDAVENYSYHSSTHRENLEKKFEATRDYLNSSTPWEDYCYSYYYLYGNKSNDHAVAWLNRDHAVQSILPRGAIRAYETERGELNDSFDDIMGLCRFYNLEPIKTEEVVFKRYIVAVSEERYDSVLGPARWYQPGVEAFTGSPTERDMLEQIEEILDDYREQGSWVGRLGSHNIMDLLLDTHCFEHYDARNEDRCCSDEEETEQNAWAIDGKSKKWF